MTQYYLAVCAIFCNETPYLPEWIAFHRLMGVEHFFLYDNNSLDQPESILAPFIEEGIVTLKRWEIPFHLKAQTKAYNDCLEKVRSKVRWLACIDIDEFLFAPKAQTLIPVLKNYEDYPGVVVHWQTYGSSGQKKASDTPVIARFQQRAKIKWIRNRRVKSIINPIKTIEAINPHHFLYQEEKLAVNEIKEPVKVMPRKHFKKKLQHSYLYRLLGPLLYFFDPYGVTELDNSEVLVEHLRINHYPLKSKEEFLKKHKGVPKRKNKYKQTDYFYYHDRNEVYDPILTRYLPDLELMLSKYKKN